MNIVDGDGVGFGQGGKGGGRLSPFGRVADDGRVARPREVLHQRYDGLGDFGG